MLDFLPLQVELELLADRVDALLVHVVQLLSQPDELCLPQVLASDVLVRHEHLFVGLEDEVCEVLHVRDHVLVASQVLVHLLLLLDESFLQLVLVLLVHVLLGSVVDSLAAAEGVRVVLVLQDEVLDLPLLQLKVEQLSRLLSFPVFNLSEHLGMLPLVLVQLCSHLLQLLFGLEQVFLALLGRCLVLRLVKLTLLLEVRQPDELDVLLLGQTVELRLQLKDFLLLDLQVLLERLLDVGLLVQFDLLNIE